MTFYRIFVKALYLKISFTGKWQKNYVFFFINYFGYFYKNIHIFLNVNQTILLFLYWWCLVPRPYLLRIYIAIKKKLLENQVQSQQKTMAESFVFLSCANISLQLMAPNLVKTAIEVSYMCTPLSICSDSISDNLSGNQFIYLKVV